MQEIKVPLDSTGLISLNKCYMTQPNLLTEDMNLTITTLDNGDVVESHTYNVGRHNPDRLFPWVQQWVDDATDVTKRQYAWGVYLQYLYGFLNQTQPDRTDMQFEFNFGFNGVTSSGEQFHWEYIDGKVGRMNLIQL
jgi:hypothetical protein